MSWDAWVTTFVIIGAFVVMARDMFPPSMAILGAVIVLLVLGVLTPREALQGFGNAAPISVAALYVIARAIEKTGVLQPVVAAMLGRAGNERVSLVRLLLPTAAASAFLNNTPIVAMLVPQVSNWAQKHNVSPSRYLMPLSFAAILGGMVTLIGTSTNLVISGMLEEHGFEPLGMFEITRIGLPVALAGLAAIVLLTPLLLPKRAGVRREVEESERDFVVTMRVEDGGPMVGQSVEQAGLRNLQGLFLAELIRTEGAAVPVTPHTELSGGDLLTFFGRVDTVVQLQNMTGLQSAESQHFMDPASTQHTFFEAVVGPASPLNGKTLKDVGFRGRYEAAVVAVHRAGQRVLGKLGSIELHTGDTLLLLGDQGFRGRWRDRSDFLLVAELGGALPGVSRMTGLAVVITVGVILTAGLGLAPIVSVALLGAMLMVITGVLTPWEARMAVDLNVVIAIAASFGLAAAIETSGLAALIGSLFSETLGSIAPKVALLGIAAFTVALHAVITNNAAAALMFPVAMSTASALNGDPRIFAMVVAISASVSFMTPIAYQTNLMVYGPGGYKFWDYLRLGIPVTIVVLMVLAIGLN